MLEFTARIALKLAGIACTFFARTKKGAKKVRGGCAHPLDSRGRRKTSAPPRSAGFTAIFEISHCVETQNTQFIFTSQ